MDVISPAFTCAHNGEARDLCFEHWLFDPIAGLVVYQPHELLFHVQHNSGAPREQHHALGFPRS